MPILDTASTSTFTALLAARERAGSEVRELGVAGSPDLVLYTSDQSHSSVEKAAIAAGLGRRSVRRVEVDESFRMRPEALEAAMNADVDRGASKNRVSLSNRQTMNISISYGS